MYKLENFTIILPSYKCDKGCPFCIAKNNQKFNNEKSDDFENLAKQFDILRKEKIRFNRIVLSGNGEPSLYPLEVLEKYAEIIKENSDMFDILRIHSSGNIFFEDEKFQLFNNLVVDVEFDVLRAAAEGKKDMTILRYGRDYLQSDNFKKAKSIKMDMALTKKITDDSFFRELSELLNKNPNIRLIRFKNLMAGENEKSQQAKWVRENRMSKDEFVKFANNLLLYFHKNSLDELCLGEKRIVFEKSGNYPKDVVFSNGGIIDYSERPLSIQTLKQMSEIVDNDKKLEYDCINR